ncbi:Cys/Met metabolism PLP-dependent enzyme-domain-containing protein [Favolaschia claudopus]|uniref:Cys/Met metabolism PLP-dependent enzyme-domain-containing protein n=1 Tax=Favolaschia claudopus TaxID=2862362 RepID=A0AAW0BXW6_9AGAR
MLAEKFNENPPALSDSLHFATAQIHAGHRIDPTTRASNPPIYASTSFVFDNADHAANVQHGKTAGYCYSRISNPTVEVFEERMTVLEGGVAAVAASCGLAAQFMAIFTIAGAGDNIISSSFLYGGTRTQFQFAFKRLGIQVKFIDTLDPADWAAAVDEKTKAFFVETISNPKLVFNPIKELSEVAHNARIPLIVDNTVGMGGYLVRPIDHGADIVVESATKWIGGHGRTLGGIIVDSGKFDWKLSGKFPMLTEPSESFRDVVFVEEFGSAAFAAKVRFETRRDLGSLMDPFAAFSLLTGLETLSLRAERHCKNALALAQWMEKHPKVAWVSYLGLESHPCHVRAKNYVRAGMYGGVLTFGPRGGECGAHTVVNNLKLTSHLANLGDTRTLAVLPTGKTAVRTSDDVPDISTDTIRVSVGIEDLSDILADFEGALSALPS